MWNVKKNAWLINFFATPEFYSCLRRCVRETGNLCALKTDIEKKKTKTKKRLFEETNWRFRFDATYIRNVTVIIFEDCNDEEHVASAVYKV